MYIGSLYYRWNTKRNSKQYYKNANLEPKTSVEVDEVMVRIQWAVKYVIVWWVISACIGVVN